MLEICLPALGNIFILQLMRHELVVAREAAVLLRRDPAKYVRGVVGMYLLSTKGIELGSTFRSAYYFVRHIDDVLDGDRHVSSDPLGYVQDLRNQVETGNFRNGFSMGTLARNAVVNMERKAKLGDNPRADFLDAIDAIFFDHERSKQRVVLPEAEIDLYYRRAFGPVVNLTLIGINSSLRSPDVPAMSYGQGRVYSVRDFDQDWVRGTINVPKEVMASAGLTNLSELDEVKGSSEVKSWIQALLSSTKPELLELQKYLKTTPEKLTAAIFGGLIGPMLRIIEKNEIS